MVYYLESNMIKLAAISWLKFIKYVIIMFWRLQFITVESTEEIFSKQNGRHGGHLESGATVMIRNVKLLLLLRLPDAGAAGCLVLGPHHGFWVSSHDSSLCSHDSWLCSHDFLLFRSFLAAGSHCFTGLWWLLPPLVGFRIFEITVNSGYFSPHIPLKSSISTDHTNAPARFLFWMFSAYNK